MQSRISYFNKAIFLNTVKRFWPVWLANLVIWGLILPGDLVNRFSYGATAVQVERGILNAGVQPGALMAACFAILAAMAVWSFAYNPRSMSGIACLPVRREGVFLSVCAAGLVPLLLGDLLVALVAWLITAMGGMPMFLSCLQWLCMVAMQLVFFYGFAVLCAQLTGNVVTLPAVYAVLNFTAWVVESVVNALLQLLVYGLSGLAIGVSRYLSPLLAMFNCTVHNVQEYIPQRDEYVTVDVYFDGWVLLAVYAAIGLVLLYAALALYRRRRMESVGDVVAIQVLKPVFKYCLTFGCALVGAFVLYYMFLSGLNLSAAGDAVCVLLLMLVCGFVGYFAAEMLNAKSFRVFRGCWRGFGVSALAIVLLLCAVEFDLLGLERRVPDAEDVESVFVSGVDGVELREQENIRDAIALHSTLIDAKEDYEKRDTSAAYTYGRGQYVSFGYVMKDGSSLYRSYYLLYGLEDESSQTEILALEKLQNSIEAIAYRKNISVELTEDTIVGGTVTSWLTEDELRAAGGDLNTETYIFTNYYGYDMEYVEKYMTPQEKMELLEEFYLYNDASSLQLSGNHVYNFTAGEMYELYTQCILPDMAEGKIGKLWIIDDEDYSNTVYAATIQIEMWYDETTTTRYEGDMEIYTATYETAQSNGRQSFTFSIVPTAESTRTTQWLADHGVVLNTVADQYAITGTDPWYAQEKCGTN